jgi:hypothetical protein
MELPKVVAISWSWVKSIPGSEHENAKSKTETFLFGFG